MKSQGFTFLRNLILTIPVKDPLWECSQCIEDHARVARAFTKHNLIAAAKNFHTLRINPKFFR